MPEDNNLNNKTNLPSVAEEPTRRTHWRKPGPRQFNRPWKGNSYGPPSPIFFPCPNGSSGPGYMGYYINFPPNMHMAPSTNNFDSYPVCGSCAYSYWPGPFVENHPFAGYHRVSVCCYHQLYASKGVANNEHSVERYITRQWPTRTFNKMHVLRTHIK
jgi:hypothetical protein